MSTNNSVARFLAKAGWGRGAVEAVCTALRFDMPNPVDASILATKLWRFVAAKQREAVLNALAKDALDRQRLYDHMVANGAHFTDDEEYQLRLDELFTQVSSSIDAGEYPGVQSDPQ